MIAGCRYENIYTLVSYSAYYSTCFLIIAFEKLSSRVLIALLRQRVFPDCVSELDFGAAATPLPWRDKLMIGFSGLIRSSLIADCQPLWFRRLVLQYITSNIHRDVPTL